MTKATASRPSDDPLAISREEAARRLGIGLETLRQLIITGRLPVVKAGRRLLVPLAGLHAFLDPTSTLGTRDDEPNLTAVSSSTDVASTWRSAKRHREPGDARA